MKILKSTAIFIALALVAIACSHSESTIAKIESTVTTSSSSTDCDSKTPEAVEIGVTADTIKIQVMADVGSPLSPGLFQGAFDGTNAWVDYVNENGGLACRQLKLVEHDSEINPNSTTNGFLRACEESLAMVGSNALFGLNTEALTTCEDKAGNPIGIPDFAEGAAEIGHQCTANVFLILGVQGECPYAEGERFYEVQFALENYINREFGSLKCAYTFANDIPSVITLAMPGIRAVSLFKETQNIGEKGFSGRAAQSTFGEILSTMREGDSNCASNSSDSNALLKWRSEAVAQGGFEDVVWRCFYQCYTKIIRETDVAEGTYMWLPFLPYEERDTNDELNLFLTRVNQDFPDIWAALSWGAGRLFQSVIESVVEKYGINGITRQNILTEARLVENFNANGWFGDISFGTRPNITSCTVLVQVQSNEFVRVSPKKRGTLDCSTENKVNIYLDPTKAYNDGPSYTGRIANP